ncbi:MAG: hypothetical protein KGN02_11070, partial [bacterium]|nr:hypothetical protein [bacterium]
MERSMGAVLNEPPPCLESVPLSTYRLQFNAGFRFKDARAILDYLQALGIGAIYASPYLRARSGSPHGYDIVAHDEINPDIGTAREHARLIRDAQCRGIAHILDVVPHHMAIDVDNRWWYDVLEWGEASPYATFFDIDWHAPHGDLEGKVLMPFLGEPCEDAIVRGALAAHFDEPSGALSVTHGTERYPLAPNSYAFALREAAREAEATLAHDLNALAGDFEAVESHPQARARFEHLRSRLSAIAASESARGAVTKALRRSLAVVLAQQHYHLAPWRTANATVNYRRFFDINNLVALRFEDPSVFARTHAMTLAMLADGRAQGVRIDHIDGLLDPADYCRRLREHASEHGYAPYLIVEKILSGDEQLPTTWGVHGTTGYDFMNAVNALFVNARARLRFDRIYRDFAGADEPYEQIVYRAKHDVLRTHLRASLDRIARSFLQLSPCSSYALDTIREALAETIASVPVYRTYATASACSSEDRRTIAAAIA